MIRRAAALVLTGASDAAACPPGLDATRFAHAMAEDVADLLADLAAVDPVIIASPAREADARSLAWPQTQVVVIPDEQVVSGAFRALGERGYEAAVLIAPDVPDLPGLMVAKPFSALDNRTVAAAPALAGGGLVALACRLPVPDWVAGCGVDLDTPDAVELLKTAAPQRRDVFTTPGWRRLRTPADVTRLDLGLEGWQATRALLHP